MQEQNFYSAITVSAAGIKTELERYAVVSYTVSLIETGKYVKEKHSMKI